MKHMKPSSARTLTWLAAALLTAGCLVASPSAAFLSLTLAALTALFPAVFGKARVRILAAALLLAAIALSVGTYADFKKDQSLYRGHAAPDAQKQPRP